MRVLSLELINFGPHEHLILNQNEIKGSVIGVIGQNGVGKSHVILALKALLLGDLANGSASWIRAAPDVTSTTLRGVFEINQHICKIERIYKSSGTGSRSLIIDDGAPITKAKDVDTAIEQLMGVDKQTIANTIFIGQGEIANILNCGEAERIKLFSKWLNLGFATKHFTFLSEKVKNLSNSVVPLGPLKDAIANQEQQLETLISETSSLEQLCRDSFISEEFITSFPKLYSDYLLFIEKLETNKRLRQTYETEFTKALEEYGVESLEELQAELQKQICCKEEKENALHDLEDFLKRDSQKLNLCQSHKQTEEKIKEFRQNSVLLELVSHHKDIYNSLFKSEDAIFYGNYTKQLSILLSALCLQKIFLADDSYIKYEGLRKKISNLSNVVFEVEKQIIETTKAQTEARTTIALKTKDKNKVSDEIYNLNKGAVDSVVCTHCGSVFTKDNMSHLTQHQMSLKAEIEELEELDTNATNLLQTLHANKRELNEQIANTRKELWTITAEYRFYIRTLWDNIQTVNRQANQEGCSSELHCDIVDVVIKDLINRHSEDTIEFEDAKKIVDYIIDSNKELFSKLDLIFGEHVTTLEKFEYLTGILADESKSFSIFQYQLETIARLFFEKTNIKILDYINQNENGELTANLLALEQKKPLLESAILNIKTKINELSVRVSHLLPIQASIQKCDVELNTNSAQSHPFVQLVNKCKETATKLQIDSLKLNAPAQNTVAVCENEAKFQYQKVLIQKATIKALLEQIKEQQNKLKILEQGNEVIYEKLEELNQVLELLDPKQGVTKRYIKYLFKYITDYVTEYLTYMQSNFAVALDNDPDSEELAFKFKRLDKPAGDDDVWLPMRKLSGGQKIKLSIAFLMAIQQVICPGLCFLVLDEPSTHLDTQSTEALCSLLENIGLTLNNANGQVWLVDHNYILERAFTTKIAL